MEHATRTARNALFNLVGFLYPTVLTIVITPVFLHYIGTEAYGIYALSVAFLLTIGVLEFGLVLALMKYVPEHIARRETDAAVMLVRAGLALYSLIGIVGALASASIGIFFVQSLFDVSPELTSTARLAFILAGVAFVLTMITSIFGGVIASLQRFDIATKVVITATTGATAVSVVLLMLGLGLTAVMVGVVVRPALGLVLFARAARTGLPGLRLTPKWHSGMLRQLASFSAYTFIANISGLVLFQLDKFFLGVFSGAALVTFYVVPGALAQRLHAAAASITSVALPTASELFSRDDRRRVQVLYGRATWLTALFLVSVSTPAAVFAPDILEHWVGGSFKEKSTVTLQILIATYLVLGLAALPYYISLAAGRPRLVACFSVASAAMNVGAIVLLIPRYGIVGAAVAYLISVLGVPVFIWYVERRVLELLRSPWPGVAARLTVAVVAQVAVCLALRPLAEDLASTLGLVLLSILVAPAVLLGLGFIDAEDKALVGRILSRSAAGGAAQ